MLKIVVFDSGWGGELVADYLERELGVVEVVRVIDWANAPYENRSLAEITQLVEQNLQSYIGQVDVIVLGGYVVSMALSKMHELYPQQKFVGLGINYDLILRSRNYPERVVVLMDELLNQSSLRGELRRKLLYSTLVMPDCSGWEDLVNRDALTKDILRSELSWDFCIKNRPKITKERANRVKPTRSDRVLIRAAVRNLEKLSAATKRRELDYPEDYSNTAKIKPDLVLLLNTHFWEVKAEIEELFGWNVRVLDFREKLLHDTCRALELRGTHGKRSK